jgi:hypothetical protein
MLDDAAPGPLTQASAPQAPGRLDREDSRIFGGWSLERKDFVCLHRQSHQVRRSDECCIRCQHRRQDPTGLSTSLSNVDVNVLVDTLVQQLTHRRNADATQVCAYVGFEHLGCVPGQRDGNLDACGRRAVGRNVEWDAGAGRVLWSSGGND